MSGKEVTGHAIVTARCPKGHTRTIHPHEIPEGQIPMCLTDRCHKPMIGYQAETCYCDWPEMAP